MAKLKLEIKGPAKWLANFFTDWENPDNDYELVAPDKEVEIGITKIPTFLAFYVAAKRGTLFKLTLDGATLMEGKTNDRGLYNARTRLK